MFKAKRQTGLHGERPLLSIMALAAILAVPGAPAFAQQNKLSIELIDSAPYPFDMIAAPSGGALAWIYNERGARNVWVAEPSAGGGYTSRRVTAYTGDDGVDISSLRWTGDGQWLVYTRGGDDGGSYDT